MNTTSFHTWSDQIAGNGWWFGSNTKGGYPGIPGSAGCDGAGQAPM